MKHLFKIAVAALAFATTVNGFVSPVISSQKSFSKSLTTSADGSFSQVAPFEAMLTKVNERASSYSDMSMVFNLFGGGGAAPGKKLVVITGTSSGLGRETAKALIKRGHFVVCAVRDPEKMQKVADELGFDPKLYKIMQVDLASLASVRKFVSALKSFKGGKPLDSLVCNAAVYLPKNPDPVFTEDGFESSMGINHLGHFLLCQLVLDDMITKKAKDQRMIIVGSITGNTNTVGGGLVYPFASLGDMRGFEQGFRDPITMANGAKFFGAKAYKDAKLCNMMTVSELHRRYHESTGVTFSSMYPGCIAETALFREKRAWFRKLFPLFMKYVTGGYVGEEEAGERLAQVVYDPVCQKSGVYWSWNGGAKRVGIYDPTKGQVTGAGGSGGEIFENDQSEEASDPIKAAKMFELSTKLVGAKWPKPSASYESKKEELATV